MSFQLSDDSSRRTRIRLLSSKQMSVVEPVCKRTVYVHVTFLKIGEIDTKKECFDADVLVTARWREPDLDRLAEDPDKVEMLDLTKLWSPKLYIENVLKEPTITSSLFAEFINGNEAFVSERWRCKSTFLENLELLEFPFDVQDLSVNIMSELHSNEVILMDEPTSVHRIYKQSFIDEQEWHLYKYIESRQIECNKDKVDPSMIRPSLLVMCRAARRPEYFIWNIFSVTFLISCLVFVTFAVSPELVPNRLALTFTLVLTAVAFKFTVNQNLPNISYLTYLDRYILANMVLIASVAFWHGLQVLFPTSSHPHKDKIAASILAIIFFMYNVLFLLKIIRKPFKKRRQMNKLETAYIAKVSDQASEKQKKNKPELTIIQEEKEDDPTASLV